jgi:hypothetical protein
LIWHFYTEIKMKFEIKKSNGTIFWKSYGNWVIHFFLRKTDLTRVPSWEPCIKKTRLKNSISTWVNNSQQTCTRRKDFQYWMTKVNMNCHQAKKEQSLKIFYLYHKIVLVKYLILYYKNHSKNIYLHLNKQILRKNTIQLSINSM